MAAKQQIEVIYLQSLDRWKLFNFSRSVDRDCLHSVTPILKCLAGSCYPAIAYMGEYSNTPTQCFALRPSISKLITITLLAINRSSDIYLVGRYDSLYCHGIWSVPRLLLAPVAVIIPGRSSLHLARPHLPHYRSAQRVRQHSPTVFISPPSGFLIISANIPRQSHSAIIST